MQRAERFFPVACSPRITDDLAFNSLPRFDFEPGIASLTRRIGALPLLRHYPFKPHLFHCLEKGGAFLDRLTQPIGESFSNRIFKPLAPAGQRFIDDWAPVQIETIEKITDSRAGGLCTLNGNL